MQRTTLFAGVTTVVFLGSTLFATALQAQETLKVGVITTLSAAAGAVPGQQLLNGFELAVKNLNGKLAACQLKSLSSTTSLSRTWR